MFIKPPFTRNARCLSKFAMVWELCEGEYSTISQQRDFPKFRGFDIFVYLFCQVSWRLEGHLNINKNICWSDLLSLKRSLVKQIPRKELDWVGGQEQDTQFLDLSFLLILYKYVVFYNVKGGELKFWIKIIFVSMLLILCWGDSMIDLC